MLSAEPRCNHTGAKTCKGLNITILERENRKLCAIFQFPHPHLPTPIPKPNAFFKAMNELILQENNEKAETTSMFAL